MLYVLLVVGLLFCAAQAIRATRLLSAALWLAGVSALLSILLYAIDAHEIAVIELSVGGGLVTVLFVFAIGIAGEGAPDRSPQIPRPLAAGLAALAVLALGWMTLPWPGTPTAAAGPSFAGALWQDRGLDTLLQIGLLFTGALGVLGLLDDRRSPAPDLHGAHDRHADGALSAAPGAGEPWLPEPEQLPEPEDVPEEVAV